MTTKAPLMAIVTLILIQWGSPSIASAQRAGPESLYRVEVLVFEHRNTAIPLKASADRIDLAGTIRLQPSRMPAGPTQKVSQTPLLWSHGRWVAWMESIAVADLPKPLIGPPEPPKASVPQLNYPLMLTEIARPTTEFHQILTRFSSSNAHNVLANLHWAQTAQSREATPAILLDTRRWPFWWETLIQYNFVSRHNSFGESYVIGSFRVSQTPLLRVTVDLYWHQPSEVTFGPLRSRYLSPEGAWVYELRSSQVIKLSTWTYFDSEKIGALVKVAPFSADF